MIDPEQAAEKIRSLLIENQSAAFDKEAAYANLVLIGGYAGAFAVWNFTNADMTPAARASVALTLGLSLTTFVFFEVYKMARFMAGALFIRDLALNHKDAIDFLTRYKTHIDKERRQALKWHLITWGVTFSFTVTTAIAGLGMLFYSFCATLLGLPRWP